MAIGRRIKNSLLVVLIVLGVLLWTLALLFFARVVENSDDFAENLVAILVINSVGIAVLAGLIVKNLVRLIGEHRRHVPGVRLRVRMVSLLVILAVAPNIIVYFFSVELTTRAVDRWFESREIEQGVGTAVESSQKALDAARRTDLEASRELSQELGRMDAIEARRRIDELQEQSGALELVLFNDANNRIIAHSGENPTSFDNELPAYATEEVLSALRQGNAYVQTDVLKGGDYVNVAAVTVAVPNPGTGTRFLLARYPVDQQLASFASAIGKISREYDTLTFQREWLKLAFVLVLSLVLLITALWSVYGAFFAAQRLFKPIQQLMQGTRAVARGDYDTQLPTPRSDEIGFLVHSFNEMTQRLAQFRSDASRSQQIAEGERQKLEVILAGLTTGVVALEPDMRIRTANQAAGAIIGVGLEAHIGEPLSDVAKDHPFVSQLFDVTRGHLDKHEFEWREQIALKAEVGRRVLMCACTALPEEGEDQGGYVIVFDDITALLQAQRDAAWGEVARRLAHEIKNPLTPIQLSAERMRRRYLGAGDPKHLELLDRATHTIIQQVEALKEMVDAFSLYARTPDIELVPLDLNGVIAEVMELYRPQERTLKIELSLDPDIPRVRADDGRIRQLFHNLMRNAIEATEGLESGKVEVATHVVRVKEQPFVEIRFADNGPGFSSELIHQAFEPYVTSKLKGTGLGLAIVKKIVEEHGGQIKALNREPQGAEISILLPISGSGALHQARSEPWRERA